MPTLTVNGALLFYEDTGRGEPLVLIHGFMGSGRAHLGGVIDHLAARHRVIAPDLRGYGRSGPKPREYGADFYHRDARDVAGLIEALHLGPVIVGGFSDGGETALSLAVQRPDLVRALFTWGAAGFVTAEDLQTFEGLWPVEKWATRDNEWLHEILEIQGPTHWEQMVYDWLVSMRAISAAGGDITFSRAHQIAAPTLLLNGEFDTPCPAPRVRELATRIPGARLRIFEGQPHNLHGSCPAAFHAEIDAFIAALPPR